MSLEPLTDEQFRDLASPLSLDDTKELRAALLTRVEVATRNFVPFLQPSDPAEVRQHDREYSRELKRIASDPARALATSPVGGGSEFARYQLDLIAKQHGIDPETRQGAAALGDHALDLMTKGRSKFRIDNNLKMAEDTLFDEAFRTLKEIAPDAIAELPSNEGIKERYPPVIVFCMAFFQQVVDRAVARLPQIEPRARKRLIAILNKSNRRILDGIRTEKQFWSSHGWIDDGPDKATIFE